MIGSCLFALCAAACAAALLSHLERPAELQSLDVNRQLKSSLQEMYFMQACDREPLRATQFCRDQHAFGEQLDELLRARGLDTADPGDFTFFGSFRWLLLLGSTVGSARVQPRTAGGMVAAIVMGLVFFVPAVSLLLREVARRTVSAVKGGVNNRRVRAYDSALATAEANDKSDREAGRSRSQSPDEAERGGGGVVVVVAAPSPISWTGALTLSLSAMFAISTVVLFAAGSCDGVVDCPYRAALLLATCRAPDGAGWVALVLALAGSGMALMAAGRSGAWLGDYLSEKVRLFERGASAEERTPIGKVVQFG